MAESIIYIYTWCICIYLVIYLCVHRCIDCYWSNTAWQDVREIKKEIKAGRAVKGYHYLSRICCVFIVLFWWGDMLFVCVRTRSMYAYHLESIMYLYYLYMCNWCHLLYQNAGGNGMKWWFGMDFCRSFSNFVYAACFEHFDLRPTVLAQMSHSAWGDHFGDCGWVTGNPALGAGWVGWSYSNGPPNPWLLNWWIFVGLGEVGGWANVASPML